MVLSVAGESYACNTLTRAVTLNQLLHVSVCETITYLSDPLRIMMVTCLCITYVHEVCQQVTD